MPKMHSRFEIAGRVTRKREMSKDGEVFGYSLTVAEIGQEHELQVTQQDFVRVDEGADVEATGRLETRNYRTRLRCTRLVFQDADTTQTPKPASKSAA